MSYCGLYNEISRNKRAYKMRNKMSINEYQYVEVYNMCARVQMNKYVTLNYNIFFRVVFMFAHILILY